MRKLMLSTAILAATSLGAVAQDNAAPMFLDKAGPQEIQASKFIGMRVYSSETEVTADAANGADANWKDIGEIGDVILSRDGTVDAVLVDVGGFLGIGEHEVALKMDAIKFVADDSTGDAPDDFFLVVNATEDALKAAPEYVPADQAASAEGATMPADTTTDTAATAPAVAPETAAEPATDTAAADATAPAADAAAEPSTDTAAADPSTQPVGDAAAPESMEHADATADTTAPAADASTEMTADATAPAADATAPAADATAPADMAIAAPSPREGYTDVAGAELTTEMLEGARVYGSDDSDVGEVSQLVLTSDGQIQKAVIDVGGFLGIGEKPVAVDLGDLQIMKQTDGDDVRVYIQKTEEELKALPKFEKS